MFHICCHTATLQVRGQLPSFRQTVSHASFSTSSLILLRFVFQFQQHFLSFITAWFPSFLWRTRYVETCWADPKFLPRLCVGVIVFEYSPMDGPALSSEGPSFSVSCEINRSRVVSIVPQKERDVTCVGCLSNLHSNTFWQEMLDTLGRYSKFDILREES